MAVIRALALALFLGLSAAPAAECDAAANSTAACRELGFASPLCSTCDQLAEAVGEAGAELVDDCLGCCTPGEQAAAVRRYPQATLEVCKHRLREFPAVEKFVRGRAGGIAGLALSHRLGALPRLRLHGGPGGESESARVDRWRGEDIEAYLADRLEGYAPAADA